MQLSKRQRKSNSRTPILKDSPRPAYRRYLTACHHVPWQPQNDRPPAKIFQQTTCPTRFANRRKILIFRINTLCKIQQSASWLETDRASARATEGRSHHIVACRGRGWRSSKCCTPQSECTNNQTQHNSPAACCMHRSRLMNMSCRPG